MAKKIIALIPEHVTYCEPFAGGAQVFFYKARSEIEILNDLDREVINFFRVCQLHHEELARFMHFTVPSRVIFDELRSTDLAHLTDIQRAARFVYMQKNAYAGKVVGQNFKLNVVKPPTYNVTTLPTLIEKAYRRLEKVQLDCRPYQQVVRSCDRETTFFYLDPPYWNKALYKFNLSESDFVEMASLLRNLKGKFLLSLNDAPEVRRIFQGFRIKQISLFYSSQPTSGKRYTELLISNYPC